MIRVAIVALASCDAVRMESTPVINAVKDVEVDQKKSADCAVEGIKKWLPRIAEVLDGLARLKISYLTRVSHGTDEEFDFRHVAGAQYSYSFLDTYKEVKFMQNTDSENSLNCLKQHFILDWEELTNPTESDHNRPVIVMIGSIRSDILTYLDRVELFFSQVDADELYVEDRKNEWNQLRTSTDFMSLISWFHCLVGNIQNYFGRDLFEDKPGEAQKQIHKRCAELVGKLEEMVYGNYV